MTEISKETIKAYALENAVKHGGKANQNAVLAGLFAEGLEKSEIKNIIPTILRVLNNVNAMTPEKQKEEFEESDATTSKREIREGLKELPNAKKNNVVMRLAPFPSGALHIGNARAAVLNQEYVKMYKGKFLLVMDDTIGSEAKQIKPEAYKLIEEGISWLGIDYDKKPIYKSDRTEMYYKYAEELLKKGYMYVCHCEQEEMHELKVKGIECACRNLGPEVQMKRWAEMFKSKMGSMTVRLKTSMTDSDPAFRDRVMFKISDRPHPRTKSKFRVYPSMEFSWAIDDHLFNVTHVLRGIEHQMSTRIQDFIRDIFNWGNPESIYNGLFAVEGVKISKSKGAFEVSSGTYIGWNDPRTWSLQSLRDRGIQPEAVRQFILNLGLKKTNITTPIETLYTYNKKLLENAPRYFFLEEPKKITIKGCPEMTAKIPLHPNNKLGNRQYETNQNFLVTKKDADDMLSGNFRLMHLLNFKADNTERIRISTLSYVSTEPKPDLKPKYIQWLPADVENIDVEIMMPDGTYIYGKGEPALRRLKTGTAIQFERFGFVNLYKKSKDKYEFWFAHK
ncbi:glutamate--tRNA ligase [Candidatus Pacearchaeota archaeon]|nr:glutamate--tRNA ligase [Candidatus Pacearchaeota archaeon]